MEIPNLSSASSTTTTATNSKNLVLVLLVVILAAVSGFWLSRFFPSTKSSTADSIKSPGAVSAPVDNDEIKVGIVYGSQADNFKDTATGTVKKGGVNGEGTHTLVRPGGTDQNAALTSSILDLDLFIDKEVEIKGETNRSTKVGWFLDVGSIKVLE